MFEALSYIHGTGVGGCPSPQKIAPKVRQISKNDLKKQTFNLIKSILSPPLRALTETLVWALSNHYILKEDRFQKWIEEGEHDGLDFGQRWILSWQPVSWKSSLFDMEKHQGHLKLRLEASNSEWF